MTAPSSKKPYCIKTIAGELLVGRLVNRTNEAAIMSDVHVIVMQQNGAQLMPYFPFWGKNVPFERSAIEIQGEVNDEKLISAYEEVTKESGLIVPQQPKIIMP